MEKRLEHGSCFCGSIVAETKGEPFSMTIWTLDFARQEPSADGRRFVVVAVPDKRGAKEFRESLHERDLLAAT